MSKSKIISLGILSITSLSAWTQEVNRTITNGYDPHENKIIPDKVFEIGLPLLFLFLIANTLVSIYKIKAENRLKEKAIDKGISEPSLITLFAQDKKLDALVYIKWFLVLSSLGIALLIIHFLAGYLQSGSGYLPLGIITIFQALAFLMYYRLLKKR
jgi:hypothetical protein